MLIFRREVKEDVCKIYAYELTNAQLQGVVGGCHYPYYEDDDYPYHHHHRHDRREHERRERR